MKSVHVLLGLFITAAMLLSACGSLPLPTPTETATPLPSNTPLPTATFTPTPTKTPKPTNTPTIKPTLAFGDPISIVDGGYSIRPPLGYEVQIQDGHVDISNQLITILISFIGGPSRPPQMSAEDTLDYFLAGIFEMTDGEYQKENPQTIVVDGAQGLICDITGTLFYAPFRGQAIIVMPGDHQLLFGVGVANTGKDRNRWKNEGSQVFGGLVNSITFSTSEPYQSSTSCFISTDKTYGYTQENPIKVGGDAIVGPSRERAYLDNLLAPDGGKISYQRTGSMTFGNTILDAYEVIVAGEKVTLYIDEYAYTEPQAPAGFACAGAFLFSEP
ncbi:MAG: hypothetical protein VB089_16930 [Anaerolineaceae bacterium]|nr:hypothetical protein [Anaerolineaceae bacterium]